MPYWHNNSVSQSEAWNRCPRRWYFGSIMKLPQGRKPATERGQALHLACQFAQDARTIARVPGDVALVKADEKLHAECMKYEIWEYQDYVDALWSRGYFDVTGDQESTAELRVEWPGIVGPGWIGKVDQTSITPSQGLVQIRDWKGTSALRNAKTPGQLDDDLQVNAYVYAVVRALREIGLPEPREVDVTLVYVEMQPRGPIGSGLEWLPKRINPNKVKVKPVSPAQGITVASARARWEKSADDQREMLRMSAIENWQDVFPNTAACRDFGGCDYLEQCGMEKERDNMGFLDKIAGKNAAAPPPPAPTPPPPAPVAQAPQAQSVQEEVRLAIAKAKVAAGEAPVPEIAPPDAPPRDTYKSAGAPPPPKEEKARIPRGPKARQAAPTPAPAPPPAVELQRLVVDASEEQLDEIARAFTETVAARDASSGLVKLPDDIGRVVDRLARKSRHLYLDCFPTKGAERVVEFADWIGPALIELQADVEKEGKVPHFQLLPFAEYHGALAIVVNAWIQQHGMPEHLYVPSDKLSKDTVHLLRAHADYITVRT